MEPTTPPRSSIAVPIAIVFGFAMIAIAIFFTADKASAPTPEETVEQNTDTLSSTPKPVTEEDYIRGNPNAPILIIEYSDYDCPFCKQYHVTLNRIIDEYGLTGKVAWVYRQFPIAQLHPNSPKVSQAALCVGEIGGNDAFWTFTDLIFEEREVGEATNVVRIPDYVEASGVDREAYVNCMDSGSTVAKVESSVEDAFNIGARGTPYTVLVVGNQQAVINGAQPYETVKGIVDNLIGQLEGTVPTETQ
jgi:protein-disulfide isomerase